MQVDLRIAFAIWVGTANRNHPTGWKTIPSRSEGWAEVFALTSKGGTKRGFISTEAVFQPYPERKPGTISTPMEAGDEIREMLQRGSLTVWRRSDEYSTDFMSAFQSSQRGSFFIAVYMPGNDGQNTAMISIHGAKISSFERAVKNGKNIEIISASFESKNASVKYGNPSKQTLLKAMKAGS
jgi:hypothetical protein